MALDFPNSPTVGQTFTVSNATWTWDGVKWTANGTPVVAIGENRIINGDMRIDQRGVASGAGGTAGGYMVDRWQYSGTVANKGGWARASLNAFGFPYALLFTSSSAYALLAADVFCILQIIEADMVSDFQWGTPNAQPVTLSFVVFSSIAGTFGGSIRNTAVNRSYPFTYNIPTAGAAYKISITIPGDTTGTWVMNGNAAGMSIAFSYGVGTTYSGPANAWAATNYVSASGAVSIVGTNGAYLYVTGVKLEVGSVATPYNRQSLTKSMADCQRYYYDPANGAASPVAYQLGMSAASAATFSAPSLYLPTTMRATPTVTPRNQAFGGVATALSLTPNSPQTVFTTATTSAAGNVNASFNMTATAEL